MSSHIVHLNHTANSSNSFHVEFSNRIDAVWFAMFINQNTILHTLTDSPIEICKENKSDKPEEHISEISSEIPYGDFLTPE